MPTSPTRSQVTVKQRPDNRLRDLSRLLAIWPTEAAALDNNCPTAKRAVIARLHAALRAERRRGQTGHWSYNLTRHLALKAAYQAETDPAARAAPRPSFDPRLAKRPNRRHNLHTPSSP
jgi:hypothetical protein